VGFELTMLVVIETKNANYVKPHLLIIPGLSIRGGNMYFYPFKTVFGTSRF
jgi:hypothetical protein